MLKINNYALAIIESTEQSKKVLRIIFRYHKNIFTNTIFINCFDFFYYLIGYFNVIYNFINLDYLTIECLEDYHLSKNYFGFNIVLYSCNFFFCGILDIYKSIGVFDF